MPRQIMDRCCYAHPELLDKEYPCDTK
jgi:hypothetical protein